MSIDAYAIRKRKLDNALMFCLSVLGSIKNKDNISYHEKLRGITLIEEMMPEIRRLLIYFDNYKKGN